MDGAASRLTVSAIEGRLNGRPPVARPRSGGLTAAAVLVLLAETPEGVQVLLTERSHGVRDHKGQVALPGGAIEAGDADETSAAIREAVEEVGLDPSRLRVIGRLDDYVTVTGYHVTPIVGVLPSFEGLGPRTDEITEVFAFPLDWIGDPGRVQTVPGSLFGRDEDILFVPCEGHMVWGATARILKQFVELLSAWSGASR